MIADVCKRMGVFAFALLAVLIFAAGARAQSLSLMAPSLANVHGRLTARFGVTVDAVPILKGELQDGLELVLKCEVGLYGANDYLPDDEISSSTFVSELKYDALTKEFIMTLPKTQSPLRSKDLKQLLAEGWGTVEVGLGSWALLDRGHKYRLKLRTSLVEKDAPEGFMRIIYFWSWGASVDNSFQLDFTY